jgi:hypothetical protein
MTTREDRGDRDSDEDIEVAGGIRRRSRSG